jgi:NitT/TauT family transport system substrate-binding protein
MKGWIGARSLVVSLAVLLVVACGGSNVRQTSNQRVSMTVLYTAATDPLPVWVAADDGIFAAHNLDVTLKAVQGAGDTPPALSSGSAQMGLLTMPDLLFAAQGGLDVVIGSGLTTQSKPDRAALVAGKDSGITKPSDLAGKRIALTTRGSFLEIGADELMKRAGVDYRTIKWVEMPFPQMTAALAARSIDAALLVPPFLAAAEAAGNRKILDLNDLGPNELQALLGTTRTWAEAHRSALKRFRQSLTEAVTKIEADPAAAQAIESKYTGIAPAVVKNIPFPVWDFSPTVAQVQFWIDTMRGLGELHKNLSARQFIVQV